MWSYRPQTKGKIENTIGYVRRDFFLGRDYSSLEHLNNQAIEWLKRVNSSVHGTTHEIPIERHKLEELRSLDTIPEYFTIREETRSPEIAISHIWEINTQYLGSVSIKALREVLSLPGILSSL
jgi:hypothetical protein